jgi:NAD(P)-dependent dehydrogenase (short-subunit alcohol dehydrogenase family)
MNPIFTLKGKTILVTGASSGIGKSIAQHCASADAQLVITARNEERLSLTLASLHGQNHIEIPVDLSVEGQIRLFAEKLPQLDGVVLCAGINPKLPVKFISADKIDEVFRINFSGSVLLVQSLLKLKRINKNGAIVFISSIAASYATISNGLYASSKGAINSFLRVLALELAGQNIRVNGIQPGLVNTGILDSYELKDNLNEFQKEYPLGRIGKPEDIANATRFLLSDAAEWITGSSLLIDGGITLR